MTPPHAPTPAAASGPSSRAGLSLVRRAPVTAVRPPLDADQQRVVSHGAGRLLVLAGPGTGKTTTIVESVVERITVRGVDPSEVLVLTFSRKAAGELRERITARIGATTREPLAMTFHSFAFALVRREAALLGEAVPRLLSGPEQLLSVRRLLQGDLEDGAADWPADLRAAMSTRGFAEEVRDLLQRAKERRIDADRLRELGAACGRPEWLAAAMFMARAADSAALDPQRGVDYAELVTAATDLLGDDEVLGRTAPRVVFVDEYQDTDPSQEALLMRLAARAEEVVVVGDPDQSIYGFRGADVSCIEQFPQRFAQAGVPAEVVRLSQCRRFGPALRAAAARVVRGTELAGPAPVADTTVEVRLADSGSQEASVIADLLRRAHLEDGLAWDDMAVLVRSATQQVAVLRRAFAAAGVPVSVAGDEVPLMMESGIRPFLLLLRAGLDPGFLDEPVALELVTGPLGGADAIGLRRLRRALRELEALDGGDRSSAELLVQALRDPRGLVRVRERTARPALKVARLLAVVRQTPGTVEDVLWAVWTESGLDRRWGEASMGSGPEAETADRSLDAVVALFDAAARFVDRLPKAGPEVFLEDLLSQEIPADSLAEKAPTGGCVRILTAHRSKGLEWPFVVVAGVQEGRWPDLRLRGSLLGSDELGELAARPAERLSREPRVAPAETVSRLLAEERRLFYVAVTRARARLVVTAVGGSDDVEERPSRFLDHLVVPTASEAAVPELPPQAPVGRVLSLPALVAELRSVAVDAHQPESLRRAAAHRLAVLAERGVPGAAPADWWALQSVSDTRPVLDDDAAVRVSPSSIDSYERCPLRWMLERVGRTSSTSSATIGSVVHALAELHGRAVLQGEEPPGSDELLRRLRRVWGQIDVPAVWYSDKEHSRAQGMVRKFLEWAAANERQLLATEGTFDVELGPEEGMPRQVRIVGRVDRVERDGQGRVVVVDLKTGTSHPKDDELAEHPQLGAYQLAVREGGFESWGTTPGGAELLQLGKGSFTHAARAQGQPPIAATGPDWPDDLVARVAVGMGGAEFEARPNDMCSKCSVLTCCPAQPEGGQVTG